MRSSDLAACRAMLNGGSRSFFAASLLLPARVRHPATALYAFCRIADDLIDNGDPPVALAGLHQRLDGIYADRPADRPEDRALASAVATHRLPRLLLDRLLEGFAWDAEGRRYDDLAALEHYAARVAGTVGAMMAVLMGVRDPVALARACDLGVAMQLTNIARDVGEDARAGRLYLPLAWMRGAGLAPDRFVARPEPSPALANVIGRLLGAAETLYRRADSGIAALPLACRPGIFAARHLYAAIGHQVIRNGCDSVTTRARVPRRRKLQLAGQSLAAAASRLAPVAEPPLAATADLVLAASAAAPRARRAGFEERVVWLVTLFGELDARQARRL
ncbi:MAG: phytoene/squalene synthase family protein [Acetobacteraceae bacterium]|nr:phytoene/squalene synthase family protein [Acetobacteraceae bacterium]